MKKISVTEVPSLKETEYIKVDDIKQALRHLKTEYEQGKNVYYLIKNILNELNVARKD